MTKLKVTEVIVKDVLGARELAMEPGQVTVISGSNGTGKTSALEAVKNTIGGGNLAKLSRVSNNGDEEISPETVLVMDSDDGDHYRIEKTGKGVRVRKRVGDTAGFEDVPQPQRWLSSLVDARMANPIEFLGAKDKDRILLLLGALPLELDRDDLWESMGLEQRDFSAVPDGLHPLQELALVRESIFRERTGVNRDAKSKSESAEQTRRATPAVLPDDHAEQIAELEKEITERDTKITEKVAFEKHTFEETTQKLKADEKEQESRHTQEHLEFAAAVRARAEEEIAEHRDKKQATLKELFDGTYKLISKGQEARDKALSQCYDAQREVEKDRVRLAELREQSRAALKAQTLHEQAERFEAEAEELHEKSASLTRALNKLDEYRRSLADDLPIPGLEIQDKNILVNSIPFNQLNQAQKISLAVQIACLRAQESPLPIVYVDGAEALDEQNFDHLCKELEEQNVQAFIGRVTAGPLEIS